MRSTHYRAGLCAAVALAASAVPVARASALPLLSEVLYDAVGADDGQLFVELYGSAGFDLSGFTLEGVNGANGATGPVLMLAGPIPADGFLVVADVAGGATQVANADLLLDFDLQNGPDSLVLRDPLGNVVDALGYGSFGSGDVFAGEGAPAPDPPAGQSLARRFADVDTDSNLADFVALEIPTPGSGPLLLPEPESGLLLGLGLFCLAFLRRR